MTKEELLAQAHREAQRRNVPVVQVLVEWLVPRMELLPTAEDVDKLRRSQKNREEWVQFVASLNRAGQIVASLVWSLHAGLNCRQIPLPRESHARSGSENSGARN